MLTAPMNTPEARPLFGEELDERFRLIAERSEAFAHHLAGRLARVAAVYEPAPPDVTKVVRQEWPPLLSNFRESADKISAALDQMEYILSRVEV